MTIRPTTLLTALVASFAMAAIAVPFIRQLARGGGLYEQPVEDRWHRRPVPKLGGVGMAGAFLLVAWWFAATPALVALVLTSAGLCALGLLDDLRPMRPAAKFAGQFAAAAAFLWFAPLVEITGIRVVDAVVALLWFVGITNAFNLLDNIDGAAAGVAAIAGAFLIAALALTGASASAGLAALTAVMVGVALGFLFYNWHPASIFMGDSGSHLLGSFFAGATILAAPHVHAEALAGDAIAVLLLFVPCVDTTLVTLTRQLGGRSAFVGGRDHLSHRIVALGLTERRAVLSLYGVAAIGGAAALVLERADSSVGWAVAGAYVIFVTAMAVYLGHIDVHAAVERGGRTLPLPSELKGRYRLYEIVFDATAISVAYLLGTLVRFAESADLDPFLRRTGHMLPVILGCHLGGLWLAGKYRRPPGPAPSDAAVLLKGVALGSIAAVVAVLYTTRFDGYSRQAFAISAVLVWVFLAGGHMTLRALDDVLRRRHGARRALIYGAGRAALAIREVMASPSLGLTPFGVIDDDPLRRGSRVEGLRVMGTLDDLDDVLSRQAGRVAVVIVSAGHLAAARLETLCDICAAHGVDVRQFHSSLEGVETDGRDRTTAVIRFPRR